MMEEGAIAALITGAFTFVGVVWQSRKIRRENTEQHDEGRVRVENLTDSVLSLHDKQDRTEGKVDRLTGEVADVKDRVGNLEKPRVDNGGR